VPKPQSVFPGEKYGRLTVMQRSESRPRYFTCECECGVTKEVFSSHLKGGKTTSCGCYHKEIVSTLMKARQTKHSMYGTPEYTKWNAMMDRCFNPNSKNFVNYGGRGITVDTLWHNFENFYKDMGDSNGLTLERVNNEIGYTASNCRWATQKEQANNRRSCRQITFKGKTQNITQWAKELNVPRTRLYERICRRKWDVEKALTYGV